MKTPGKNLIMVDYAHQDRRSTSAMLLGKGDGREQKWIEFSEKKQGFFTEDELYFLYQQHCAGERTAADEIAIFRQALFAVGVLLFVVF